MGAAAVLLGVALAAALWALWRARAARARAERLLRLLADGMAEQALLVLDASGRVAQWNTGARRLHGYAAAEIVGQHCSRLYAPQERGANLPQKELELAARQGCQAVNGTRIGKDGRSFAAEVMIHALRDRRGHLSGFCCIERDLSAQVGRERALEQARAALAQAQKLAAVGRLGAGITHELNNIVQVIGTCAQTLQRRLAGDAHSGEFLQMIRRNAEHAAILAQRLRGITRRAPGAPVLTNVNEVVAEVVELLRHALSEDIVLDVHAGGGLLWTVIDPNQLEAALLSLAVSARDALAAGGTLLIETAEALEAAAPPAGAGRAGHYIRISVARSAAAAAAAAAAGGAAAVRGRRDGEDCDSFGLQAAHAFIEQSGGLLSSTADGPHSATVTMYLPRRAG
jgi:PAS domain S-box-containing protein